MNANTLKAITRHGETLLAIFPNSIYQDPVVLCKSLRKIETLAHHAAESYCNGTIREKTMDQLEAVAFLKLSKLLGVTKDRFPNQIFLNRDPRGYALKFEEHYTAGWNLTVREKGLFERVIPTDMGGYGILAPDLTEGNR